MAFGSLFHGLGFFAEFAQVVLHGVVGHVAAVEARDFGDGDLGANQMGGREGVEGKGWVGDVLCYRRRR